jgi:hypothetical protein
MFMKPGVAEVVGSTPTWGILINLGKYGIELNSILTNVGHIQQQCQQSFISHYKVACVPVKLCSKHYEISL